MKVDPSLSELCLAQALLKELDSSPRRANSRSHHSWHIFWGRFVSASQIFRQALPVTVGHAQTSFWLQNSKLFFLQEQLSGLAGLDLDRNKRVLLDKQLRLPKKNLLRVSAYGQVAKLEAVVKADSDPGAEMERLEVAGVE